jgi:hypothetical protein
MLVGKEETKEKVVGTLAEIFQQTGTATTRAQVLKPYISSDYAQALEELIESLQNARLSSMNLYQTAALELEASREPR